MLEVRNLKKIYKTKQGADVNALDGVSISFPTTGMVFLLGKSGSGKSTLLNVCGGLDNPSDGEIIVKGRSSKDFSQSDFDSYRNTFIGFIFQEYNILNEFSVEDNIALALELQGKPKDKAAINALLEEVDLTGFAKRKPNTLSGGQKQRIAIARALIKKPEIIMADEPTGALDSNTGKQVFDTLKKLSRTKLVIVVSHDRDFAEQYGDRIIELKDGKILSDVSKTLKESETVSGNVNAVGDVLCVKGGSDLTETDFEKIKSFLKKNNEDIIIAADEKSVTTFKKAARITDGGAMEVFSETIKDHIPERSYTKEESRFIRSKLPARHAFKIGVSGLRHKPVRLFFTVMLCTVAFILFGLLSTLNFYDSEATFKHTLIDTNLSALRFSKLYTGTTTWYTNGEAEYTYEFTNEARFSPAELNEMADKFNHDAFGALTVYSSFNLRQVESSYWINQISAFAVLPEGNSLRNNIIGEYPKNKNEIAVSSYFAQMMKECKVYSNNGSALDLQNVEDIIGKSIMLEGNTYMVSGIVDSGNIDPEFDLLKENSSEENYSLIKKLTGQLESGLHLIVFVSPDRLADMANNYYYNYKESKDNYMRIATAFVINGELRMPDYANSYYSSVANLTESAKLYTITDAFGENHVIVPSDLFARGIAEIYSDMGNRASEKENYTLLEKYGQMCTLAYEVAEGGTYEMTEDEKDSVFVPYTDDIFDAKMAQLLTAIKKDGIALTIGAQLFNDYTQSFMEEAQTYTIASIYKNTNATSESTIYLADATANHLWDIQKVAIPSYPESETSYKEPADAIYSAIYLPGAVTPEKLDDFWAIYSNKDFDENSCRITLTGGIVGSLQMTDDIIKELSTVFLYVGLVLAIFAALLLSNFISVSISQKKREIGILRAVGARSTDVFKIFFSESFVIGAICTLLSAVATMLICNALNVELATEIGASILVFGLPSLLVLIAIAFVTVLIATFLPVYNAAKKKPVDSIRAL